MKLLYLVFLLTFSSLILVNVIPAYAQTTESPTSASMVCSGSVIGTFDILFDGIWDKWNRYACSSTGSASGEIVADFETIAHTDSVRIFATGYTWHGTNSVSQKMYYSSDGTNWIYLQDLVSRHYNNHGTEYTVTVDADLRYIKTTFNISDDWIGLSEVERTFQIVIDTTPPTITLTGANPQSIELGDDYTEIGATTDDGSPVTIDSSAFSNSLGSYFTTYNSVDSEDNDAIQVTRTVNVVDTTSPVITAPSDITAESTGTSTSVTLVSATATDHSSFTITNDASASFPLGVTIITWTATDSSGNESTTTQTVTIVDTTSPVITLTGNNPQSIELGDDYTELGATTNDNSPVTIDSSAFSNSLGTYFTTYNSIDSSGNQAIQVIRTVNVIDTTPSVIPSMDDIMRNDLLYNHTRSTYNSTTDKIIFTASKQQDIFSLFCKHFTQSTEEWNNQTDMILYNATFLTKHTSYIRCYDESQNIILFQTVYKPYDITSGFEMINESFGNDGLFGVPFPFLMILIVASIWTGRNAQVGVIVTGATIGVMGLLGLFELSAEIWAMIVLLIAVGMFLGKKVF